MKTGIKIIGAIGLVLILSFIIGLMTASIDNTEISENHNKDIYKKVITFKGNGIQKSEMFSLHGKDAKIIYKYKSELPTVGIFGIYVMHKEKDIMKDGGVPDIMISSPNGESENIIQKPAGEYYLNINSAGNWEVQVLEKQ